MLAGLDTKTFPNYLSCFERGPVPYNLKDLPGSAKGTILLTENYWDRDRVTGSFQKHCRETAVYTLPGFNGNKLQNYIGYHDQDIDIDTVQPPYSDFLFYLHSFGCVCMCVCRFVYLSPQERYWTVLTSQWYLLLPFYNLTHLCPPVPFPTVSSPGNHWSVFSVSEILSLQSVI